MPPVVALVVVALLAAASGGPNPPVPVAQQDNTIGAEISAPSAPAGRLPPGPLVVEPAREPPTGVVRIEPGITRVRAAAGASVQPELLIVNGAEWPLDLTLTVTSVAPGPNGAPTPSDEAPEDDSATTSAAGWVSLPTAQLHLGPAEQARLRPTVSVPQVAGPGGYVTALRVSTPPGAVDSRSRSPEVVSFLLVEVPDAEEEPVRQMTAEAELARHGLTGAQARVRLIAQRSELVTGLLEVNGWWGATVAEVAIPPTVVLAAVPRTQEVEFRAPVLPGPYNLTASLETATGGTLSASVSGWLWNPLGMIVVLAIILTGTVLLITRPYLRGRS